MPNPLFNIYGNMWQQNQNYYQPQQQMMNQNQWVNSNGGNNILSQFMMLKNNPGAILDIMLQNGKINQQQYNDLQQYRNNPEMMARYLMNNGKVSELSQAEQLANQYRK